MTTQNDYAPGLSPDQLVQLYAALEVADSVELKVTVPDSDRRSAVAALDMDPLAAELRQVFFFDTPDLVLNQHGLIVRARRTRKGDDSVVKLRPIVPSQISAELRGSSGFGVEVDSMPGAFVCSARMMEKGRGSVKKVATGERPLRSLFTKRQRAFFAQNAPAGIELDDLSLLGPITVLKLKFSPEGYDRRLVAELWTYPDGSRILELSTKCVSADAFEVAARTRAFLERRGLNLTGEQQTKTKTALEFFSEELRPA